MSENGIKAISVTFREFNYKGEPIISEGEFRCWNEEGSYTLFYEDVSLDSVVLVIPTTNVIRIDIIR